MSPQPSPLTIISLVLLLVLALLLFLPLLGHPVPLLPVAGVLALRLALRVYQGYHDPALRRPTSWLIDGALLVMLLMQRHS